MSYLFRPNHLYRMPTHFGPSLGARQGVNGRRYECIDGPNDLVVMATFKANKEQLEALLPPGFSLREPYTVVLDFSFITNIEWLAGRGYNTFGVSTPVTYHGKEGDVHGDFSLVLWENKADPIITGREDLGVAKIYCEIPEPQCIGNDIICRASWDGFEFASLKLSNLKEVDPETFGAESGTANAVPSAGGLYYKYIPKTGCPGEADAAYVTLMPEDWPNMKVQQLQQADAAVSRFREATWEQLPTLVHIVNCLSDLTLGECTQAIVVKTCGGKDLSDVRIVH
ncbi:acetoacetate decarboxylase family protein [Paremcibacter congregatus]|uniref:Acetoacetate decarboxylase n=1 Tax=Paremcibacter congregatus TaxID=2043170 RepID=A0A2G4YTL4_9PROT|nr:acetoacetate decarboxylase family protein [Paremcibacter congregatus]PHZ84786.1 hypothetical protein CRD36_10165 [Paremcibacter congregatus]QDE26239.1 hypothetical protein FIV45_02555 [Paremcibacter congregatus]